MSLHKFQITVLSIRNVYVEAEDGELACLAFEEGKAAADPNEKDEFLGYVGRKTFRTDNLKYATYTHQGKVGIL